MITLINYGSGNIHAIANIYKRLNIPHQLSADPAQIASAEKLILPGVGDFDETMALLNESGITAVLHEVVKVKKVPIMGVCVGMQILGDSSEEGNLPGLGWIKGRIKKFDAHLFQQKPHLPHMGWNTTRTVRESTVLQNMDETIGFYFLHSYYFECADPADLLCTTHYGQDFASAINHDNVYGFQFHPEKSHQNGIELFRNFANL
jgi:imidazole glycerol-phosphate synthase subunit HisH